MSKTNTNISPLAEPQDMFEVSKPTGNIYKSIVIIAKRANQIGIQMKEELHTKLEEFASTTDNLEEVFENREQIEISKFYERQPSPTLLATREFMEGEIYSRDPSEEKAATEQEEDEK